MSEFSPHVSSIEDTGNMRVCILRGNKPISGSFSFLYISANTGKTRKMPIFGSCGEYAQISPCLPKYDRFAPHLSACKGL
jgi:hypothetical protein